MARKIVQINTVCGSGSTGRIMADLYEMSEQRGYENYCIFGRGKKPEQIVGMCIGSKPDFYMHVLRNFFRGESGFGSKTATKELVKWLRELKPDVIHLHNLHGFYLQVELLFAYLKEADVKVIWTLHDCWPFTGHCAFFDYAGCHKWKKGCKSCAYHRSAYPYALFKDNAANAYVRKAEAFSGVKHMTIVTPSKWLGQLVRQSFLKEYPVVVIPNGINLECFRPTNRPIKGVLRRKKIVLGVANIWEKRKGLMYFEKLAQDLPSAYQVVVVGVSKKQKRQLKQKHDPAKLFAVTRTESVEELAAFYTAADVFVNATLEDNYPTTNMEAQACGTPVITFDTGGSSESVPTACGMVVPKGDYRALYKAVLQMTKEGKRTDMCLLMRDRYDQKKCFEAYMELYKE